MRPSSYRSNISATLPKLNKELSSYSIARDPHLRKYLQKESVIKHMIDAKLVSSIFFKSSYKYMDLIYDVDGRRENICLASDLPSKHSVGRSKANRRATY